MAKIAVISDIHGNLEALACVLRDIQEEGVKRIICLGDVIGYGPDSAECLTIARRFDVVLCGNHEWAVLHEPLGFHAIAKQALLWTARMLRPHWYSLGGSVRKWRFLKRRPKRHKEGHLLFVHGSPRSPVEEYILRTDVDEVMGQNTPKLQDAFEKTDWITFVGHTHSPAIITEDAHYVVPKELKGNFTCDKDKKYIINVGSVGQPRDKDPRACYVIFDPGSGEVVFRRVMYDVNKTVDKIKRIKEVNDSLGKRLKLGK